MNRHPEAQAKAENSDSSCRSEEKKCHLPSVNRSKKEKPVKQAKYRSFVEVTSKRGKMSGIFADNDQYHDCKEVEFYEESNLNVRLSKSDYDIHLESEPSSPIIEYKSLSSQAPDMAKKCRDSYKKYNAEELTRGKQKNVDYYFDYKQLGLKEGCFFGNGKHWDGNDIDIYYKVKIISFGDKLFYCVWVSRDPWEFNDANPSVPTAVTGSPSVISASVEDSTTRDVSICGIVFFYP